MVDIYENNGGTIKAYVDHESVNLAEIEIEAEYEAGDPGERERFGKHGRTSWGSPAYDSSCEITRVFVDAGDYGEINLDMTKLSEALAVWEKEVCDEIESEY